MQAVRKTEEVTIVTITMTLEEAERLHTYVAHEADFDLVPEVEKFADTIQHLVMRQLEKADVKWMDSDGDMCT